MDVQYQRENSPLKNIVVSVCCSTYLTEFYTLGNALQTFLPCAVRVQGTLQKGMVQHFHPDHKHILCRNVITSGPFEFQTKWHRSKLKYWKDNVKEIEATSERIFKKRKYFVKFYYSKTYKENRKI